MYFHLLCFEVFSNFDAAIAFWTSERETDKTFDNAEVNTLFSLDEDEG